MPNYLAALVDAVALERQDVIRELESLQKNIEHIKTIVNRQQHEAKIVHGVVENVVMEELLEEALKFQGAAYERYGADVQWVFDKVPTVRVDRHKVFQIVMNFLTNARHAVRDSEDKRVTVRLRLSASGRFTVEVEDTGCAISAENLQKIFTYGFPTKVDGHGFGLHSAACAAAEMGGTIVAHSEGAGRGARFTLELPIEPPRENSDQSGLLRVGSVRG